MNLTYEIIENGNGYLILKDGTPWIKQTTNDYIPHPADTMEESAEAHIAELIEMANAPAPISTEDEIASLKSQVQELQLAIAEIGGVISG